MFKKIYATGVLLLFHTLVFADDWGCQVALCMSNPAGPMAVAECVAPIQRLYNALAHKQGWPSCGLAQAPSAPPPQFNPTFPPQGGSTSTIPQGLSGNNPSPSQ